MSTNTQHTTTIAAIALIPVYSLIMMITGGAASWAWLLLIAASGLITGAGRRSTTRHNDA